MTETSVTEYQSTPRKIAFILRQKPVTVGVKERNVGVVWGETVCHIVHHKYHMNSSGLGTLLG